MSFGNLNILYDKTSKFIEKNVNMNDGITLLNMNIIKKKVFNELIKDHSDVTTTIIDEIFTRLFSSSYTFNKSVSFNNGMNCFREFEETYPDIKVPSKYLPLEKHFNKLQNLPQPAQRSKEWYDYRYNRITASDTAAAIDLNPYEPVESFILKKCDPNFPFRDNATVFHGKKYEPTATMIYEHIYNTRVFEFGALPSEKYSFLGASPDGISSKYTLDNVFSERLGTMLEIKCPVTRDIHTSGTIAGDICPFYYYCQVQQQLACCELETCDFWQCKLSEYSRNEYLSDDTSGCSNTIGTAATKMVVDNRLKKGIILEFFPRNFIPEFEGDNIEWKSKYIIPKRLDMDDTLYEAWVIKTLDGFKELYPEIHKDYVFNKIIYWKLEMSHNVAIKRDDKFLESIIPVLKDTWSKICYYRKNLDKLDVLKVIETQRKKYIKMNTSFVIQNDNIIKNKLLFLDPAFNMTKIVKPIPPPKTYYNYKQNFTKKEVIPEKNYESDGCDFVGNDDCDFIDNDPIITKTNKKEKSKTIKVQPIKVQPIKKEKPVEDDDCDFID